MKSFIKLFGSMALLVMFCLTLSSYDSVQPVDDPGNGTIVEVVKGGDYYIFACGDLLYREKNTQQYKDGLLHMRTTIYQLPEGNCAIPDKATKVSPWPGYTLNYTPSGRVVVKEVYNN